MHFVFFHFAFFHFAKVTSLKVTIVTANFPHKLTRMENCYIGGFSEQNKAWSGFAFYYCQIVLFLWKVKMNYLNSNIIWNAYLSFQNLQTSWYEKTFGIYVLPTKYLKWCVLLNGLFPLESPLVEPFLQTSCHYLI